MTTDAPGLREAAEKYSDPSFLAEIRAHADHLGAKHRLPATRQVIVDLVDAVDGFAQHYLATHPSDGGEAISEEWLREIGGVNVNDAYKFAMDDEDCFYAEVVRLTSNWAVFIYHTSSGDSVLIGAKETRDDLLHLLAALGCPVNSEQHPNTEGGAR